MSGAAAWTGRGAPTVAFASANTFSWLFSNPFEEESDFTPSQQRVPRVEDGRPLFVDEANGLSHLCLFMPCLACIQQS